MSYTALPTKNPGDLLTSALWNTYLQGNADSGFRRMLGDTTLTVAAATIDFTAIPATFAHLLLVLYGRGDAAATVVGVGIRFNGDSAADYHAQTLSGSGATASAGDSGAAAVTSGSAGDLPAGTSPASAFGGGEIEIPHYANAANQKIYVGRTYSKESATGVGSGRLVQFGGVWMAAAAAINRITLILSAGNFAAGTRATLYGDPQ